MRLALMRCFPVLLLLPACDWPFDLLPPLPSATCGTFVEITQVVASDAGFAQVTFGCNQGSASACDGGVAAACPDSACVEVDWVSVAATYNGNCSSAAESGLTAAATCVPLPGDAGTTEVFVPLGPVPTPMVVFAHFNDGGQVHTCDSACASAAITCECDAALAGTSGQDCVVLK